MLPSRLTRSIAVVATAAAVAGGAYGVVSASGGSTAAAPSSTAVAQGSHARSGPAAGGSIGTVSSVSASSFTLLTSAGEKVTVRATPATTYERGTTSVSSSAVTKGKTALVLGTTDSATITATQIIVQPLSSGAKASSKVIPFKRGAPSAAKTVGQIPANYQQGSGTIVSGTAATEATKAALTAYPGGIVDRVVRLSNGEYEVHNIGVNWPHHIFVSKSFEVVGAD
jgi:Domain of unknown function (DUF5666)